MTFQHITALLAALSLCAAANAMARQADFDGDGRADLAIGVTGERVSGIDGAGGVAVLYGKDGNGLDDAGDQFWTRDSSGVNADPDEGDDFGGALAVGDFDNDGFSDLAIGVDLDDIGGVEDAGSVTVLYGSSSGLRSSGDQFWHRDVAGVLGDLQEGAHFGTALAAGDFDGDGRDDLAIGVSGQDLNIGQEQAGEVHILYGSNSGLTASGDAIFNEETQGIADTAGLNEFFGNRLASGDFDGNNRDDLAISAQLEQVGGVTGAGAVYVLYGTSSGLRTTNADYFTQDTDGIEDEPETGDQFGRALAAGDFDHNGKDDLVIGVPFEDINGLTDCGLVHVLYGSSGGLRTDNADAWSQDSPGVENSTDDQDWFGYAVATGDFDGDGRDDLAISVAQEAVTGGVVAAGAVNVLYGSSGGLVSTGDQFWHQNSTGILDHAETAEFFGSGLTAGDYDDDGRDDLAIGVQDERISGFDSAGAVNVIYGSSSGLSKSGNQFWHQNSSGIQDAAAANEFFGTRLR